MKKIIFTILMLFGIAYGQTKGYFRYDSTQFEKVGGNNELIILNGTRGVTGGVLTNTGNGRTGFVLPAMTVAGWKLTGNASTIAGTNFIGTTDPVDWVTKINNIERLRHKADGKNITITSANTTNINDSASLYLNAASLTSGHGIVVKANSLSTGAMMNLQSVSTAAAGAGASSQRGLNISLTGVNATSTASSYGAYIQNQHTGTAANNWGLYTEASGGLYNTAGHFVSASANGSAYGTNTALYATATQGQNNYAAIFDSGRVGIGTIAPSNTLHINGTFRLVDGSQGTNKILQSDNNGLSTWVNPSSIVTATPTWQQTLTAGSTLTGNNTIAGGNFNLLFNGNKSVKLQSGSGLPSSYITVFTDSILLANSGEHYYVSALRVVNDTTNYKPMVYNASNDHWAYQANWPTGGGGGGGLTVGTTAIASGTTTRILYDNAGTLGEYTLTGTGTVVAMQTAPTFVTSATVPLVIGSTSTTGDLSLQTTSGVGTTGADMHFLVGNNGATEAMTILNNGNVGIGTATPASDLDITKSVGAAGAVSALIKNSNGAGEASLTIRNDNYYAALELFGSTYTTTALRNTALFTAQSGIVGLGFATLGSAPITFSTNGITEDWRIDANGSVSNSGANAAASAALDITSTTKGLLIPRQTTAQRTAISSPATGLQVYDTDLLAIYVYNGSAWVAQMSAGTQTFAGAKTFSSPITNTSSALTTPVFTGVPTGTITSGTYTPTLSNTTNVTSSTPIICHYTRIGNEVTVTGSVTVTTTLSVATVLGVSLPIASNLAAITDLSGLGNPTGNTAFSVYIEGNTTTDIAELNFLSFGVGGSGTIFFTFTYTVI